MMIVIVEHGDASIEVVWLVSEDPALLERAVSEPGQVRIRASQVPLPDARFRACWRWSGQSVQIDLDLARGQRLGELRRERDRRLAALDGPWMRAMGQGKADEAAAIEANRQALRDLPQILAGEKAPDGKLCAKTLAQCATPEELLALEPDWP